MRAPRLPPKVFQDLFRTRWLTSLCGPATTVLPAAHRAAARTARRTPAPVVDLPGLEPATYQLYPLADHVADKLCATIETYGDGQRASTRYRDLVDLVLIARTEEFDARALRTAIEHELRRRGLPDLTTLPVPSPTWMAGYAAAARRAPGLDGHETLDPAMALVRRLLDPVLQGRVEGRWSPQDASWVSY